jgi:cytochrome P450
LPTMGDDAPMPRKRAMESLAVAEAARLLADPLAYTEDAKLHAGLALLREQAPVVWVDNPPYRPFWAITKHADIRDIESNHVLWINEPRPALRPPDLDDSLRTSHASGVEVRALVETDGERHRAVRTVGVEWFRPKAMRELKSQVDRLAKRYVDHMAEIGPQCDFVVDVAANFPGDVIYTYMGLPESDFPLLLRLTQEAFGQDDNELQPDGNPVNYLDVIADFFEYFRIVVRDRRENPTADLSSAIANARINGRLMSDADTLNYFATIAAAGHDTTKASIAGGLLALIRHPAERERLTKDLSLMPTAVEEMIRWSTPVKEFMRTATADTRIRGVRIAAGESAYLAYESGNRDSEVFDEPFRFDVGREPNRHLGFGAGIHFCLGAALARMEIASFFTELLPRLRSVELAGEPRLIATTLLGGLKRLPLRYELR